MSVEKRDRAKLAGEYLKTAKVGAREAKKIFENIGDKDGAKIAESIEKEASRGQEYVEKRLGPGN
jgi:hypothetical protein